MAFGSELAHGQYSPELWLIASQLKVIFFKHHTSEIFSVPTGTQFSDQIK
jgi:hypothetical protein